MTTMAFNKELLVDFFGLDRKDLSEAINQLAFEDNSLIFTSSFDWTNNLISYFFRLLKTLCRDNNLRTIFKISYR